MKYSLLILLFGFAFVSCDKDDDPMEMDDCDTTDVTYSNTVSGIFNASCATAGCHVDGNEMSAFFSLEGYEKSKTAAEFGRMVGAIKHTEGFSPMPKGGSKLDDCDIEKVEAWINAGYPQ